MIYLSIKFKFCQQPPCVFCVGVNLNKKRFQVSLFFIITCCLVSKDRERQEFIVTIIITKYYQNDFRY